MVTTAEMFDAVFNQNSVCLETGMLEPKDLMLSPLEYCAVNYRPDDNLSIEPPRGYSGRTDVLIDLTGCQLRTVFVVRATAINKFLRWAGGALTATF